MKKNILILLLTLATSVVSAMPLFNVPTTLVQPNGDTLHCFVSGDEYYHRLHDANGYTIVQNPQTGYWVYADTVHTSADRWQVVPTDYVAGRINPNTIASLSPNVGVDHETWLKKQHFEENIDAPKTSGANHGRMNNLVVFIRFSDQGEMATPISTIDSMLNDSSETANSMYNYFKHASYNKLSIVSHYYPAPSNDTIISYQDIYPREYYMLYINGLYPTGYQTDTERNNREHNLLERAVNYVNANSPVPNTLDIDMDNDGNVDNVCFVIEGVQFLSNELLWPHKGTLSDRNVYINGKRVMNYTFVLEGGGSLYFNTSTFCHEMFHTLGAPDLYRYNNTTLDPSDFPVGQWDLMANNTNPPQQMSAYMKWKYGNWIDSIPTITHPGTYTLHSLGDSTYDNCCYKIATQHPNQWYVLEYRDNTELFETTLPGKGLLIYRIDTRYIGNSYHDEVYLFRPSTSDNSPLIPLGMAYFSGSTSRNAFTPQTNPFPTLAGNIADTAFAVVEISVPDSTISFTYAPICTTPNSLSANNITDTSALLSWQTDADSVLLQWHSTNALHINSVVVGGQSLLLDTLLPSTEYEWRVKSICAIGDSSWFTPWDTFHTSQCLLQESTIGVAETTSYELPFNTWYNYSWTQMIYTSAEVGEVKEITALAFNYSQNTLSNKNNCVIYIGTTTDSAINISYGNPEFLPSSQLQIVYEGPISCVYGWNTIELDRPFYYNGTDNLVVAIDDNSGIGLTPRLRFYCSLTPGRNSSITCYHDDINIDPDGTEFPYSPFREVFQFRADIRFIGCPLTEMPVFHVNASPSDSTLGSVSGGGIYDVYSLATITAIPEPHYHFAYWLSGNDTITANPYTFMVNSDTVFTANFAIDTQYISVASNDTAIGYAWLLGADGEHLSSAWLPYGSMVDINADARQDVEGYQCTFLQWSDGDISPTRSVALTQDTILTALFEMQQLDVISVVTDPLEVVQRDGGIEIIGAEGEKVALYDVVGRCHWSSTANGRQFIPVSRHGVYLLRIGCQARKIVF